MTVRGHTVSSLLVQFSPPHSVPSSCLAEARTSSEPALGAMTADIRGKAQSPESRGHLEDSSVPGARGKIKALQQGAPAAGEGLFLGRGERLRSQGWTGGAGVSPLLSGMGKRGRGELLQACGFAGDRKGVRGLPPQRARL